MAKWVPKEQIVCVYVGRGRLARLDAVVARLGKTRSAVVRELVDDLLARFERSDERRAVGK